VDPQQRHLLRGARLLDPAGPPVIVLALGALFLLLHLMDGLGRRP
jgi:hypothetical protein